MDAKFDMSLWGRNAVYLKPIAVADLPDEVRIHAGDMETLFAVHNSEGEQVALVKNARLASTLIAAHDMQLVTVH